MDQWKVKNKNEAREVISLGIYLGQLLLQNGAEIYRAEDTVQRFCESRKNLYDVNVFALPSAIFVSLEYNYETITMFKNVGSTAVNLEKVDILNTFSRKFVREVMSISEAKLILREIESKPSRSIAFKTFFAGIASSFFSILFGGNLVDFLCSFTISMIVYLVLAFINKYELTFFIDNFIGAFLSSTLALFTVYLNFGNNLEVTIIGTIMILVPGVTITNAVRDIMSGDFLCGLIGLTKAIFSTLAIALGIGVILTINVMGGF